MDLLGLHGRAWLGPGRSARGKEAATFFGWVFLSISLDPPHVHPVGRTCGEPTEIELTPVGVELSGTRRVPCRRRQGRRQRRSRPRRSSRVRWQPATARHAACRFAAPVEGCVQKWVGSQRQLVTDGSESRTEARTIRFAEHLMRVGCGSQRVQGGGYNNQELSCRHNRRVD